MPYSDRRTFLQGAAGVIGGSMVATGSVVATGDGESGRFLINLREVSRNDVPDDVEIIHDVSAADVLVARGDQDRVGGATATVPDVKINLRDDGVGAVEEREGPRADESSESHNHDGAPSYTEYQWDKREQEVSNDLTDKPDESMSVHDVTTGEGTRVAVVDSGVYAAHPDLENVVNEELSRNFTTDPYDFRPNGAGDHGTHVAGTIAATNDNDGPGGGALGTAPDTEIVALRMFSGMEGHFGDAIAAFQYAADVGCDAINYSVGLSIWDLEQYPDTLPAYKQMYEQVADYVRSQGTVLVNSAGNAGLDMDAENTMVLPTEAEGVFGVAATGPIGFGWGHEHADNEEKWLLGDRLDEPTTDPAPFTNYGEDIDVSAGGGNYDPAFPTNYYQDLVFSTIVNADGTDDPIPGYGWKAGTSMAAPQVSAAVALVRSLNPDASVEEVESLIRETASMPDEGETYHGDGHLDLTALVNRAQ